MFVKCFANSLAPQTAGIVASRSFRQAFHDCHPRGVRFGFDSGAVPSGGEKTNFVFMSAWTNSFGDTTIVINLLSAERGAD